MALALLAFAAAGISAEQSFKDSGYPDFFVEGANKRLCNEYVFVKPQMASDEYPLLSLKAEFMPVKEGKAEIDVFLNGERLSRLTAESFYCSDSGCWARLNIEKEKILEENRAAVCMETGNSITKIKLTNESKIGGYRMPVFLLKDFVKSVDNQRPFVGNTVNVKVSLKNSGSREANVELRHVRSIVEETIEKPEIQEIGNTYFFGAIKPGETRELNYKVKFTKAEPLSLPPAIVYYTNIFGEPQQLFSDVTDIIVLEHESTLKPEIIAEQLNEVGRLAKVTIAVKNQSLQAVSNAELAIQLPAGIQLAEGNEKQTITSIQPQEIKYFDYVVTAGNEGSFELGCRMTYITASVESPECGKTLIFFKQPAINPLVIGAVILTLLGVMIYFYLYYR